MKEYIKEQTSHMSDNAHVALLDELAWWASEEAEHLNYDSGDMEDYDE